MDDAVYLQLNKSWKSTCRILLGQEVGDLLDFEDYLKRYMDPIENRKSALSKKEVAISSNRIPVTAPVIGHDELAAYEKMVSKLPFNINEIQDIDSILAAAQERAYYTGNTILGNSSNAIRSHRCVNVNYVLGCQDLYNGKYAAFTTSIFNSEYSFGCRFGSVIQFCIKVLDPYKLTRCMEMFHSNVVSDSYYSASLEDCSDCMFSFNQRSKRNLIGNLQLSKERYAQLKAKLVAEIAEELKSKKSIPSIIDIIRGGSDE